MATIQSDIQQVFRNTKREKTTFVLFVDDFEIKYHNKGDLDHLMNALRIEY